MYTVWTSSRSSKVACFYYGSLIFFFQVKVGMKSRSIVQFLLTSVLEVADRTSTSPSILSFRLHQK